MRIQIKYKQNELHLVIHFFGNIPYPHHLRTLHFDIQTLNNSPRNENINVN